jgi:hypothetical protein
MDTTDSLIGKHLLVGITYLDHNDVLVEQVQLHGTITEITKQGITLLQSNGETFSLPPDPESLKPAPAGNYRLRSTGEIVKDPDLLSNWTCIAPPPDENKCTSD